ncbi:ABC-type multidrug transport system ATPase subunit [Aquimarina sp. EL_43]|uniref:ABC transporter ATP-binding protein n=1 Tax=unclassified Aquimarina TaxID=2627091 RepID=UPI0018CA4AF0|nr:MULTISPECIES: ABC transporter ATP-binding protein [unclassified Aquimarina]MBG6129631.1 ABC-type multidrug transport system ATPase subunit [Aquimarina sp. EL_35]MBG6150696.1 ABC-type multidrug transport system ATPase subunit [Aquimarina sp. EL_32]MBG6167997.1 ABC-type multidrug transport system ATPase subunit [Aquimarina sp. EL_43]
MNRLHIQNLSKTYPNGVRALDNVSLTITNGMFGLLGPNGAGKSSLMRTIASLQEPTSGKITFNDKDIVNHPQEIRNHLGYLPQEFGVYPKISAQNLLHHIAILKGISNKSECKDQVEALLQQTNLYQHRKKAVHTFSGGMRQRFGVAQALLGNPQLIIVDEPTAGLDPEERNRFLNLLSEIGENVIVILSTHIVEDVRDLCANMAIMGEGKIIKQGNPIELTKALAGNVWTKTITKEELQFYKEQFNIISTRLVSGKTQIQVFAETIPENGFETMQPDLESVYFSTLFNNQPINS